MGAFFRLPVCRSPGTAGPEPLQDEQVLVDENQVLCRSNEIVLTHRAERAFALETKRSRF